MQNTVFATIWLNKSGIEPSIFPSGAELEKNGKCFKKSCFIVEQKIVLISVWRDTYRRYSSDIVVLREVVASIGYR